MRNSSQGIHVSHPMLIVFHTDGNVNRHRKSEGAQYQISKSHIDDKKQTSFTKSLVTFKENYGEEVSYND